MVGCLHGTLPPRSSLHDGKVLKRPKGRLKVFRRPFYLPR
ncbi:hypothetical protein NEISICOT_00275 [Neisseria sicca ATCC 29256]|uniref:Uncharacterized protein n=1 Tax=Neisseria sicca ATCC 29256 TaxID=547045 RepID=C6M196_NEISI|nr:hypothetical protein NEISICOT_00275 [Neisseria sicca ATCC 29256]